ncbi:MAG: right-handed parallel beta-helix repeat-containing protein, partial [Planctomycetota bacterium]
VTFHEVPGGNDFTVQHSCVGTELILEGVGNSNTDPLLGAWSRGQVFVDSGAAKGGDGSAEQPYQSLASALSGYDIRLSTGSHCVGVGPEGENLGADLGLVEQPGQQVRTISISSGGYEVGSGTLVPGVSIEGPESRDAVIRGTMFGLGGESRIQGVTVTDGFWNGGIVIGIGETASVANCSIEGNQRGIRCRPWTNVSIRDVTFLGNSQFNGSALRMGHASHVNVEACTFLGNWGAPVRAVGPTIATFTNCLFAGNQPVGRRRPLVLSVQQPTPRTDVEFRFCTFDFDERLEPGFDCLADAVLISNCILRRNPPTAEPCAVLDSTLLSADPGFVRPGTFDFGRTRTVETFLGPIMLPDYIVQPGDYRLLIDSEGVDAADPLGAPPSDIRGIGRPCGDAPDLGAYERGDCEVEGIPFTRGNINGDPRTDISDPVFLLTYLFLGGEQPKCLKATDANDSGRVDLSDSVYMLTFLFLGGPTPRAPFEECGLDPTFDDLSCEMSEQCP